MFNTNKIEIKIEGMHCGHCSKTVQKALKDKSYIKSVKVDLKNQKAKLIFTTNNINLDEVEQIVKNLGYIYGGVINENS